MRQLLPLVAKRDFMMKEWELKIVKRTITAQRVTVLLLNSLVKTLQALLGLPSVKMKAHKEVSMIQSQLVLQLTRMRTT